MVYSEYTQLDEFSSIMFMFIHYLTSSVRALFRIRPATPGHLGWGLGNGLCPMSVKKKTSLLKQDTHSKLCILFKIMFIKSHTELELPENLRGSFLGLIHFWCWNYILEGTLRIEALSFEIWSSLPGVCLFLFYQEIR